MKYFWFSGALIGLQNLGLTCFMNTLLQALASCASFVEWMESCYPQGNVATALYYVLKGKTLNSSAA